MDGDTGPRPYEYRQLETPGTIRIFCLDPAESHDCPLRGALIHYDRNDFDQQRKYTAVSYTWGSPDFSENVLLNDGGTSDRDSYLKITENVKAMLEHFRKQNKRLYLWIDYICLNQNDDVEKAQQISQMGEIFHQAHKTYFWLGVQDGFAAADVFTYFRLLAVANLRPGATKGKTNSEGNVMAQIHKFLKRAWFFRRWILQEAGLSRHGIMWCSRHTLHYDLFVSACQILSSEEFVDTDDGEEAQLRDTFAIKTTLEIDELIYGSMIPPRIPDLLWKFHQSDCSVEKDRIGALCGLLPLPMRSALDMSASYVKIYQDCAVELARMSPYQLLYHLAQFHPLALKKGVRAPSWIPDWSRERLQKPFIPQGDVKTSEWDLKYQDFYKNHGFQQFFDYRSEQAVSHDIIRAQHDIHIEFARISTYNDTSSPVSETEFSICEPSDILRVQWTYPTIMRHGIPICAVISVPTKPDRTLVPSAFVQSLQKIARTLLEKHHLDALSSLISTVVSQDQNRTPKLSDIRKCLADLGTLPPAALISHSSSNGHAQFNTEHLPPASSFILRAFASSLFARNLALLSCDQAAYKGTYTIGPATLETGHRLIPFMQAGVPSLESKIEGFTLCVVNGSYSSVKVMGCISMMGVRLLRDPVPSSSKGTDTAQPVLPLRATYVGVCLGFTPWRWKNREGRTETNFGTDEETAEEYVRACEEEVDPPYVIDII